ncbi:phosphotransferase family protein [Desertimonas flava]|uniref:phosphotransferase family protein n=1 Tax=Desertimonas flava TaxID=2064846 RepID=UPI000E3559F0|nr:phosphotransferase [Desertimonas flava]
MDGRRGLVMTRVDGNDLLTALARNPFLLGTVARVLAVRQAELHDIVAPPGLPALSDALRDRITVAGPLPDDLRRRSLQLLDTLDGGDRLCHGDLHPGNLVGPPRAPTVIDWAGATRGPPVADVARTQLLLREGVVPDEAPPMIRMLAPRLRGLLAARHLNLTRRRRPIDVHLFERWTVVWAAARLAEDVEPEHPAMLRRVRAWSA